MNQNEEYFKALYQYQLKMAELHDKRFHKLLSVCLWMFGLIIAFVAVLMFVFLPDFWPWNQ